MYATSISAPTPKARQFSARGGQFRCSLSSSKHMSLNNLYAHGIFLDRYKYSRRRTKFT